MSLAVRCDNRNCGKYFVKDELAGNESASFSYTLYDHKATIENGYQVNERGTLDLCPDCTKKMFEWLGIDILKDTEVHNGPLDDQLYSAPEIFRSPFSESITGFLKKDSNKEKEGWNWK